MLPPSPVLCAVLPIRAPFSASTIGASSRMLPPAPLPLVLRVDLGFLRDREAARRAQRDVPGGARAERARGHLGAVREPQLRSRELDRAAASGRAGRDLREDPGRRARGRVAAADPAAAAPAATAAARWVATTLDRSGPVAANVTRPPRVAPDVPVRIWLPPSERASATEIWTSPVAVAVVLVLVAMRLAERIMNWPPRM